jgi:hypothetical protein
MQRIAGNLIAFAAGRAIMKYGGNAVVSLVPKTLLYDHYINKYHFAPAGKSLFIGGISLSKIITEYDHD